MQQSEHFAAGQAGLRVEARVSVWGFEYKGEKSAVYRCRTLEVYRTHYREKDGRMELYLGERAAKK